MPKIDTKILVLDDKSSQYSWEDTFQDNEERIFYIETCRPCAANSRNYTIDTLRDFDLVVFVGGTDVNPRLYGHEKESTTDRPDKERDIFETEMYHRCSFIGLPMVGICRGAQFLHVMNGGLLDQHVPLHQHSSHSLFLLKNTNTFQKETLPFAPADHHQVMVKAKPSDCKVLATDDRGSYEVLYYQDSRSLCHQPHPEWGIGNSYHRYFLHTISKLLNGD